VPICLYPKSVYKSETSLDILATKYINNSSKTLILICDYLSAYNSIIMGSAMSFEHALFKTRHESSYMLQLFGNMSQRHNITLDIRMWGQFYQDPRFRMHLKRMKKLIKSSVEFENSLHSFISEHLKSMRCNVYKSTYKWEERYVTEEIAMSTYITEILGYSLELWEDYYKSENILVDPIAYLYSTFKDSLLEVLSKQTLERKLIYFNKTYNQRL